MTDELLQWRSEFPILEKTVYLISHSLGAMPKRTYEKLHEYADKWATRGVRAWAEGWWDMPVSVGNQVASIIGADPGTVVMHQNVSICQSLILSCLNPTPERNKIVYSELNFPSVMYVYEAHARDGHLQIETVKSDDGITVPLERMLAAIDETTLLVPFSHVLFKSAFLQDAKAIIDRAHEVGAMVVLDTYQSGVRIEEVRLQKVDPPTQVIDAFRDVQAARADRERLQNEAQAYASRVLPEARGEAERILAGAKGYKEQTVAEATGQTSRFLKVLEEYKKAPDVTRRRMYLETMERVLGGTDKIIIDGKAGQGVVPFLPLDQLQKRKEGAN